jgi:hypothetical protein
MNTIATGNGFEIGYQDGIAVQTDSFGDEIEATEGAPFTDSVGQEYSCYDAHWVKTDECGN